MPETGFEHGFVLCLRFFGATLYAIATAQIVSYLLALTEEQDNASEKLVELSDAMVEYNVPEELQGGVMQAAVAKSMVSRGKHKTHHHTRPKVPEDVLAMLPRNLRETVLTHVRANSLANDAFARWVFEGVQHASCRIHPKTYNPIGW